MKKNKKSKTKKQLGVFLVPKRAFCIASNQSQNTTGNCKISLSLLYMYKSHSDQRLAGNTADFALHAKSNLIYHIGIISCSLMFSFTLSLMKEFMRCDVSLKIAVYAFYLLHVPSSRIS